ncbi:Nop53-domain-containing protein, partial [Imleria badia]
SSHVPSKSKFGAPSQLSQSSCKGKRAWRKNIDIQPVEQGLESLRAEEQVVGSILQKQTDDQLFVVDTKGDDQDKGRLLRIAKHPRKGPFNATMDPTEFGAGSAAIDILHAVRHSGGHDLWDVPAVEEIVPEGLKTVRSPYTLQVRWQALRYSKVKVFPESELVPSTKPSNPHATCGPSRTFPDLWPPNGLPDVRFRSSPCHFLLHSSTLPDLSDNLTPLSAQPIVCPQHPRHVDP